MARKQRQFTAQFFARSTVWAVQVGSRPLEPYAQAHQELAQAAATG